MRSGGGEAGTIAWTCLPLIPPPSQLLCPLLLSLASGFVSCSRIYTISSSSPSGSMDTLWLPRNRALNSERERLTGGEERGGGLTGRKGGVWVVGRRRV